MQRRDLFPLAAGLLAGAVAPGLARAADKKTLALVTNGSSDFWTFARRGIEKAQAELPNYTMELHVLAQSTAAEQKQVLDDLLTRGVAGVSVSAIDPTNETDILNKVASQAVLFTTDSDAAEQQARALHRHRQRRGRRAGGPADQQGAAQGRQDHAVRRHHGGRQRPRARRGHQEDHRPAGRDPGHPRPTRSTSPRRSGTSRTR